MIRIKYRCRGKRASETLVITADRDILTVAIAAVAFLGMKDGEALSTILGWVLSFLR